MDFHSGFKGTATINGTELATTRWSNTSSAEVVQFRNSKTGKNPRKEATFQDADFQIVIDYDFDANPFAAPLNIRAGDKITNTRLYLRNTAAAGDAPTGDYWHYPSAIVVRTPQSLEVNGRIETTIECTADGTFGPPGSPVA